ncbi:MULTISPECIES: MobF family relaxase [unclassified Streptomyces]|uniref:MobF family relaxase n=1 Tax=unclassified Streptomyces TaxID=2593676 RepID=UPI00136A3765|nr:MULTISPECIES: MobF family relaxase [unclassified Streptomyces]NEA02233.1 relaxase domain-containing protein [Streptomyces sp. SID10116]MYY80829.1 relaxase domain-containing protein [Streptomyces sp. SID335]MYZ13243.1 relaxase domain-containing protein [Streptomyces sp. SID337]NDZ88302.1 relaxase domain-containing protein [Streptomyces sp. SID10115]NEB49955.1 relaxase domain-containing protein [Streptomyces sp. SID339]
MTVDIRVIRTGQMYRYYLRETVVGDGRRPSRLPLRAAQEHAGVPAGRWMGRGLAVLGLAPDEEVTEAQLRNLFGERGRHPYADRIEADRLAKGDSPKKAFKAGALGRRVTVTGVDFVFRPQPTIYLLWAFGDDETRRMIEAAHERVIERVLEWIEDEVAVIRYGKDGIYRVRPPGGLVAARFRHYEARSGRPLLHDHLLLSVKGQRLDGKWGSIHTTALHENTVAASALYNELVAAEVCEALGLATEPRIVTPGRRPVMEIAGVPHQLIRWTSRRSDQIAACLAELEHEYVTAIDDDGDGEPLFLPVVSERARAKMNQIAARKTRPPKRKTQPLAQLRVWWKVSAILNSKVAADVITNLLEHARAAAAAIRARVAAVVDVALAAVDVTATVFVMNEGGRFHRRHLLAEARRHLALVLRGRRRDPGLDDRIVAAAISTYCLDISEPKTTIGLLADYRLYTARWDLADLPARPRPPTPAPDPDRQPPADPGEPAALQPPGQDAGEWEIPRIPLQYDRAVLAGAVVREKLRTTTTAPAVRGRAYDVVAHQQAAMPEQLLAPEPADPEPDEQEQEAGCGGAIDMTALRALRESRTDVEALDLTADRLRRIREAGTKMVNDSRARADRHTPADADAVRPVRPDDQQAHRPQQPGPHRGREAGH